MPQTPESSSATARDLAIAAARLAAETRCRDVVVLDVAGISPITDFLVLGTGTSARQIRAVCDDVQEMAEPMGFKPLTRVGDGGEKWILIDFVHVVVHVFTPESRSYYDLDNLWGDGKKVDWQKA